MIVGSLATVILPFFTAARRRAFCRHGLCAGLGVCQQPARLARGRAQAAGPSWLPLCRDRSALRRNVALPLPLAFDQGVHCLEQTR